MFVCLSLVWVVTSLERFAIGQCMSRIASRFPKLTSHAATTRFYFIKGFLFKKVKLKGMFIFYFSSQLPPLNKFNIVPSFYARLMCLQYKNIDKLNAAFKTTFCYSNNIKIVHLKRLLGYFQEVRLKGFNYLHFSLYLPKVIK